jgi:peptidoglycan/xylan/chitin deacetylase (PgdA/CDA1 family)
MIGNLWAGVRTRQWAALCFVLLPGLLTCLTAQAVSAADCPGHPDALGTSRTLVVDPREHPRIGTMQYPETLPLDDHEVVLTFDDGPLPRNSDQILQILAAQCVKATFFTIGRMAQAYPEGVRKLRDAGHTIGTHTQNHPLGMDRMPIERARQEIDDGIASVTAALGDSTALAPFFRFPGLARAEAAQEYLASRGIQVWSADFLADDWRHISSSRVYELAIKRLEDKGKGILLLHDIQARTVAALPGILRELKTRGYRVVHVVPATPQNPPTPTEPQQWQLHPASETVAISRWPKIPGFVFASAATLPAPSLSDLDWQDGALVLAAESLDRAIMHGRGVPMPRQAPWPMLPPPALDSTAIVLPVPAQSIFEIPEGQRVTALASTPASHRAERTIAAGGATKRLAASAPDEDSSAEDSRKRHARHARRAGASHIAARGNRPTTQAHRGALKHLVQVKKRSV